MVKLALVGLLRASAGNVSERVAPVSPDRSMAVSCDEDESAEVLYDAPTTMASSYSFALMSVSLEAEVAIKNAI